MEIKKRKKMSESSSSSSEDIFQPSESLKKMRQKNADARKKAQLHAMAVANKYANYRQRNRGRRRVVEERKESLRDDDDEEDDVDRRERAKHRKQERKRRRREIIDPYFEPYGSIVSRQEEEVFRPLFSKYRTIKLELDHRDEIAIPKENYKLSKKAMTNDQMYVDTIRSLLPVMPGWLKQYFTQQRDGETRPAYALTFKSPAQIAILQGYKDIENRSSTKAQENEWIAMHVGKLNYNKEIMNHQLPMLEHFMKDSYDVGTIVGFFKVGRVVPFGKLPPELKRWADVGKKRCHIITDVIKLNTPLEQGNVRSNQGILKLTPLLQFQLVLNVLKKNSFVDVPHKEIDYDDNKNDKNDDNDEDDDEDDDDEDDDDDDDDEDDDDDDDDEDDVDDNDDDDDDEDDNDDDDDDDDNEDDDDNDDGDDDDDDDE
jgi:hypothetical protein